MVGRAVLCPPGEARNGGRALPAEPSVVASARRPYLEIEMRLP
jgi:hypothetical protein